MGVSLTKGANVDLTKQVAADNPSAPPLTAVMVGLGWDVRTTTGTDFDLDASAALVGANGKVASDDDYVFFNNTKSADGSVSHTGDNLTGQGDGDDEKILVNLATVPANVEKIVFPVAIYDAANRGQNFGQVRGAFIRIVNEADNVEIARYDLSEDAATETAMVFGELYRHDDGWKFRAIGQGFANAAEVAKELGVNA
jgi:tellurium resistance protein TerD